MKGNLKILAIHGLWEKSSVFNIFRRYFRKHEFYAPDIDWGVKSHIDLLDVLISEFKPDVIIGYSYGAYAVQQLFEQNPEAARLCVLIAPVGPKGLGVKSFLKTLLRRFNPRNRKNDKVREKFSTVISVFPLMGKVYNPIKVPTLIISGDEDDFVSHEDAEKTTEFHGKREGATHYHFPFLSHSELISAIKVAGNIKLWLWDEDIGEWLWAYI